MPQSQANRRCQIRNRTALSYPVSLSCLSSLGGCPEALDRYLPALIKLLSRLTQELNSVSAAKQQQRILQQQSSQNRSKSKEENTPVADYGSVAHCVAECVRAVASRVVATGVIDHKQLFLRMLLQLVNDKGTHGAVLVAILDALCDWVDDAALGPYDPLRSYTARSNDASD